MLARFSRSISVAFSHPRLFLYLFISPLVSFIGIVPIALLLYPLLGNIIVDQSQMMRLFGTWLFLIVLFCCIILFMSLMCALLAGFIYLSSNALSNQPLRIFRSLGRGLRRFPIIVPIIAIFSLVAIVFFYGFLLIGISHLLIHVVFTIVSFGLIFSPFVLAYENRGVWGSFTRSLEIFYANIGRYFLLILVFLLFSLGFVFIGKLSLDWLHYSFIRSGIILLIYVSFIIFKTAFFLTLTSLYHESVSRMH